MQAYQTSIPFWNCTVKIHIPNATVRQKCMVYDCMSLSLSKQIDYILFAPYLKPLLWCTPESVSIFYLPFWGILFCSCLIQSNFTDHVFSHIVQNIMWGCWGRRLQSLTLAMGLIWNWWTYAQNTGRSHWLLTLSPTSETNDGSSSMFVPFKMISCLFLVTLMLLFFLGGDFFILILEFSYKDCVTMLLFVRCWQRHGLWSMQGYFCFFLSFIISPYI